MGYVEHKTYRFDRAAHWHSGLSDLLEASDAGLTPPTPKAVAAVTGSTTDDCTTAVAFDPCGELHWVRPGSCELVRALDSGTVVLGTLRVGRNLVPAGLAIGLDHLWLLSEENEGAYVHCFASVNRQPLAAIHADRKPLALCEDGDEGVWVVLGGDTAKAELVRFGTSAERLSSIALPAALGEAAMACGPNAKTIAVLDYAPQGEPCECSLSWRLWIVDLRHESPSPVLAFSMPGLDACPDPTFRPELLAMDCDGRIHLMQRESGELWTLSPTGEVLQQLAGAVPKSWWPVSALAAHRHLVVAGRPGLGRLCSEKTAQPVPWKRAADLHHSGAHLA